jgi:phage tail sheath protein FI
MSINTRLTTFLQAFWNAGGLKGRTAKEAFFVICNDTNNTPASIENGEVHVQIGVALQTPAEFIVIEVSQFTGGSTFTETL